MQEQAGLCPEMDVASYIFAYGYVSTSVKDVICYVLFCFKSITTIFSINNIYQLINLGDIYANYIITLFIIRFV